MVIGNDPNNGGYAIFYLMVRVEREGKVFGIPTVKHGGVPVADPAKLIDEPQFCVFHIFEGMVDGNDSGASGPEDRTQQGKARTVHGTML